jgi:copper homeostasis protein
MPPDPPTAAPIIEICVEGIDGVLAAEQGGADRAELCASLAEGGVTPSLGTVKQTLLRAKIPFFVIVRPRGGDFLYSDTEFETMLADVDALREIGTAGIVVGCLLADGTIDEPRMKALMAHARPMRVTCHRAFDMTADPHAALEALIRCGVDRVLTSGQTPAALDSLPLLRSLVEQAGERIIVMVCGRLGPDSIATVRRQTQAREMHFSAPLRSDSKMSHRNQTVAMGAMGLEREYVSITTDPDHIRRMIAAARKA